MAQSTMRMRNKRIGWSCADQWGKLQRSWWWSWSWAWRWWAPSWWSRSWDLMTLQFCLWLVMMMMMFVCWLMGLFGWWAWWGILILFIYYCCRIWMEQKEDWWTTLIWSQELVLEGSSQLLSPTHLPKTPHCPSSLP